MADVVLSQAQSYQKKVEGELDRALFCFNFPPDVDDVAILLVGHGEDAD